MPPTNLPPDPTNPPPVPPAAPPDDSLAPVEPHLHNPLAIMQPGEQTLFELKRHPIGIISIYVATAILLLGLAVIGLAVLPHLAVNNADQVRSITGVVLLLLIVILVAFNLSATVVYWGNRWILTTDSLTQMRQTSVLHKQISQLEIESLEDVTADQNGFLQQIFHYGTLKAETAGQRSTFIFLFAPNPDRYAKIILEACEKERMKEGGHKFDPSSGTSSDGQPDTPGAGPPAGTTPGS